MTLVERLRECAGWVEGDLWDMPICLPDVLREAADLLEKHVPPCKLGDTAYGFRRTKYTRKVVKGTVTRMYYGDDMRLGVTVKGCGGGYIGRNVFLTREEAERALEAMQHGKK